MTTLRRRTYEVLEAAKEDDSLSRTVDCLLIVLISLNVAAVVLESVAELSATYGAYFFVFEMISVGIFTVEYLLRVWSCVENEILNLYEPAESPAQVYAHANGGARPDRACLFGLHRQY
ncbi:MAG: hypothetical protein HN540_02765 [Rhodospirillaceae bacterium]|nr:hypothetical protein [Rhodospirillaceae bacterium]MBT7247850.1 hypothetical protein [Rhodospirillaceae bacterium]